MQNKIIEKINKLIKVMEFEDKKEFNKQKNQK